MIKRLLVLITISLVISDAWATVMQVKENGKIVRELLLSTKTPTPNCRMKGGTIEECYFNLNIYSCKDELRIYSVDVLYQKDVKKMNLMKNIVLAPARSKESGLGRYIKSFELERVALIDFNRHFAFEQINLSQFKCELKGDLTSAPLKANLECQSIGPLKVRFEVSAEEVDIFKWCGKPHIIR